MGAFAITCAGTQGPALGRYQQRRRFLRHDLRAGSRPASYIEEDSKRARALFEDRKASAEGESAGSDGMNSARPNLSLR